MSKRSTLKKLRTEALEDVISWTTTQDALAFHNGCGHWDDADRLSDDLEAITAHMHGLAEQAFALRNR